MKISIPTCAACGGITSVTANGICSEYQCVSNCAQPNNYGCGCTRPAQRFQLSEKRPAFKCAAVGLLDSLYKQEIYGKTPAQRIAHIWRGLLVVTLHDHCSADVWLDFLKESSIPVLEEKSGNYIIQLRLDENFWKIFTGAYPCENSIALQSNTRVWFHFETVKQHHDSEEVFDQLSTFCETIGVVVGLQPLRYLRVPFSKETT